MLTLAIDDIKALTVGGKANICDQIFTSLQKVAQGEVGEMVIIADGVAFYLMKSNLNLGA